MIISVQYLPMICPCPQPLGKKSEYKKYQQNKIQIEVEEGGRKVKYKGRQGQDRQGREEAEERDERMEGQSENKEAVVCDM